MSRASGLASGLSLPVTSSDAEPSARPRSSRSASMGSPPEASDENALSLPVSSDRSAEQLGLMKKSENSTLPLTRLTGPKTTTGASGSAWATAAGAGAVGAADAAVAGGGGRGGGGGGRGGGAADAAVAGADAVGAAVLAAALAALAARASAGVLAMSLRLMRPASLMVTRAKKSTRLVSLTSTRGAVPGAVATARPRRFRLFQASSSSPTWASVLGVKAAVLLAWRSSTTASPLRRRLTPLSVCARATWPR